MICDFRPGQKVTDFFIVRKKEIRTKHESNDPYLSLELGDASGRIFGSLWKNVEEANASLKEGDAAKVRAMVIDWRGRPHLSIERIRPANANDKIDLDKFVPKAAIDFEVVHQEILSIIKDLHSASLKCLLESFFTDSAFRERFGKAPGGKLWHHCYTGGLAEHILAVTKLAMRIADFYPRVQKDVLIAGALLHDVGKVFEYETKGFIDFSDEGRLHGHIAIGYHLVADRIEKIDGFPKSLRDQVLHLILSHQGKLEQGAPVTPMTREALILYYADELDSKLNAFERIFERENEAGKKWSQYVRLLDRYLFFGDSELIDDSV